MVGIGSKSDHAPPFACSVKTFAKANCPHRTPFYFWFLPAPMAANEMSLVQITTPFSSLGNFLYDTFQGAIVGIIFSGKSHTFLCPPGNKFGFPCAQSHPNRQRSHMPYARCHHKKYPFIVKITAIAKLKAQSNIVCIVIKGEIAQAISPFVFPHYSFSSVLSFFLISEIARVYPAR